MDFSQSGEYGILALVILLMLLLKLKLENRQFQSMTLVDAVFVIILGHFLSGAIMNSGQQRLEAALTLAIFAVMYFLYESWRSARAQSKGVLLFHNGQFLSQEMRSVGISESKITQAAELLGIRSFEDIEGVILMGDGRWIFVVREVDSLVLCKCRL